MRSRVQLALMAAFVLAGCAGRPQLVSVAPGPGVDGAGPTAADSVPEAAALQVSVPAHRWNGQPATPDDFHPVAVRIQNGPGAEREIRYGDFMLVLPDGDTLRALDPRTMEGTELEFASARHGSAYRFSHSGFHFAPLFRGFGSLHGSRFGFGGHGFGRGLHGFGHGFGHGFHGFGHGFRGFGHGGHGFHGYPYTSRTVRMELPTGDMLRAAVPEGYLESGGTLEGFLYFPPLPEAAEEKRVTLVARLSARDEGTAASRTVEVPLVYTKEESVPATGPSREY